MAAREYFVGGTMSFPAEALTVSDRKSAALQIDDLYWQAFDLHSIALESIGTAAARLVGLC
jgi:hypothetical protein